MNEKDVKSLLLLLEDPDPKVYEAIRLSIFEHIDDVKPYLNNSWVLSSDILYQERIQQIHDEIEANQFISQFNKWLTTETPSLIDALTLIENTLFPEYEIFDAPDAFKKLRHEVWLVLTNGSTAIEKIKILNHILYSDFGLAKPENDIIKHENLCLSYVLSKKKADPLMQCLLYSALAQSLGLPVYMLALPDLYILAYKDAFIAEITFATEQHYDVLFYIHPWENGALFGRSVIDKYILEKQIEPSPEFYKPLDNSKVIYIYLKVLARSFSVQKNSDRQVKIIRQMMASLDARF